MSQIIAGLSGAAALTGAEIKASYDNQLGARVIARIADLASLTYGATGLSVQAGQRVHAIAENLTFDVLGAEDETADIVTAAGVRLRRLRSEVETTAARQIAAKAILDAHVPVSSLPQTVALEKLRNDYDEFAGYTPLTPDGVHWKRSYYSNRIGNSESAGLPRLFLGSETLLYEGASVAKVPPNPDGAQAQPATETQSVSDGTQTGTWTAPETVEGVEGLSYSTTTGDAVEYTVTGAARVMWRTFTSADIAGVAAVTITESAVEIPAGDYAVPLDGATSRRLVDLSSSALSGGLCIIPLADLDPLKTYTVRVEVDPTNPAGRRIYDGGVLEFDALAFDAEGISGFAQEKDLGSGRVGNLLFYAGNVAIYRLDDVTRIDWRYIGGIGFNTAELTVFDIGGSEVAAVTVDTDGPLQNTAATVAEDLPRASYYLRVSNSSTVTGDDARIYDRGAVGYDVTTPGTPGVHEFDLQGQARVISGNTTFGQSNFIAGGNVEYAVQWTATDREADDSDYAGGVHNYDDSPTDIRVWVDGVEVDYAGAAELTTWTGRRIRMTFSCVIRAPEDNLPVCRLDVVYEWTAAGAYCEWTETVTRVGGAWSHDHYAVMLNSPNRDTSGTYANQGQLAANLNGGFDNRVLDGYGALRLSAYNRTSVDVYERCDTLVHADGGYAIAAQVLNRSEIDRAFYGMADNATKWCSANDRDDYKTKTYGRTYRKPDGTGGVFRPEGHSVTVKRIFRAYRGDWIDSAIGA